MHPTNGNKHRFSKEVFDGSIKKASNPAYDEKNPEFMKRQLEILEMDTSTDEQKEKQSKEYKELKDEMTSYIQNKDKSINKNKDMTVEALEKKLNDLEVAYAALKKGVKDDEKAFYTNTIEEINSLQDKLKNIDKEDIEGVKEVENQYKELMIKLGLESLL